MRAISSALFIAALMAVAAAQSNWGDPQDNSGVSVDTAGLLPSNIERAFLVAWNFLRTDPQWWATNFPQQLTENFLTPYYGNKNGPVYFNRAPAGSAHYQATQMQIHSPATCTYATGANCLNPKNLTAPCMPPPLDIYCCFRQENCDQPQYGPDNRIYQFGLQWNATGSGGYGECIASGPPNNPLNMLGVVGTIACNPPFGSTACSPTDPNDPARAAIFDSVFNSGGPGYSAGGKESNYWVFDVGYNSNTPGQVTALTNPIASAMFVTFNSSLSGWTINFDPSKASGSGPVDPFVVVAGVKKDLSRIGNAQNYFLQDSVPSTCTPFAFGAGTVANTAFRYPSTYNLQLGCSADFVVDSSAQSCGTCDGICFQNQCYTVARSKQPASSASTLLPLLSCVAVALLAALLL